MTDNNSNNRQLLLLQSLDAANFRSWLTSGFLMTSKMKSCNYWLLCYAGHHWQNQICATLLNNGGVSE